MARPGPSELPPTPTVAPVAPPPLDEPAPTAAQLKADIESGRTGDKNPVRDPALAPLGTDDEAAGSPPSPVRVALARHQENFQRWFEGARRAGAAHHNGDGVPVIFAGFIGVVSAVLLIAVWLVRSAA
jgi:hypothetical protein